MHAYLLCTGVLATAEQINPHGAIAQKTETRIEETFQSKQKNALTVWHNSANKCACEYFAH